MELARAVEGGEGVAREALLAERAYDVGERGGGDERRVVAEEAEERRRRARARESAAARSGGSVRCAGRRGLASEGTRRGRRG